MSGVSRGNTPQAPTSTSVYRDYASLSYEQQRQLTRNLEKLEEARRRALVVKRVRRLARVSIVATRQELTARSLKLRLFKRRAANTLTNLRQNQYRLAAVSLVVIFAVSSIVPTLLTAFIEKPVVLSKEVKNLVGESRDDVKQHLSYSEEEQVYEFAVPEEQKDADTVHTGRNASSYEARFAKNAKDGITLTETKMNVDITLRPQFFTAKAQRSDGDHLVYKSGNRQLIYGLKYNGLKEDIIIPKFQSPNMSFKFTLDLPQGVEARLENGGGIGIYSSDPSLFGNITYGSDADREKVDKARQNGEKE